MSIFEEIAARNIKCEICGSDTIAQPGLGWDNDRIICSDVNWCCAEYVFATSTEVEEGDA